MKGETGGEASAGAAAAPRGESPAREDATEEGGPPTAGSGGHFSLGPGCGAGEAARVSSLCCW